MSLLTLYGAGKGGGDEKLTPPSHTFATPLKTKKIWAKLPSFTLCEWKVGDYFCSQITFSVLGRGLKWSKLPQFHKGGPCREQQEGKITNQNRCPVIHVAHNFLVIFS